MEIEKEYRNCAHCVFSKTVSGITLYCCRLPPQITTDTVRPSAFPLVQSIMWCGEFQYYPDKE